MAKKKKKTPSKSSKNSFLWSYSVTYLATHFTGKVTYGEVLPPPHYIYVSLYLSFLNSFQKFTSNCCYITFLPIKQKKIACLINCYKHVHCTLILFSCSTRTHNLKILRKAPQTLFQAAQSVSGTISPLMRVLLGILASYFHALLLWQMGRDNC